MRRTLAIERARFDARDYRRELIERGDGFELWLLSWLPGQRTRIHDHGGAMTAAEVLSGLLREEHFERRGVGVVRTDCSDHRPGIVDVHGPDKIHRIEALTPTMSLLLYLPGMSDGRTFEELA